LVVIRLGGVRARDCHNPTTVSNLALMFAHDFSDPPSHAIARDGGSDSARGNEAGAKAGFIGRENAEQEQTAAFNAAVCSYPLKFRRTR
jgi:hypothetical protein